MQNQLAYNGPSRNPFASTGATRSGRVVISNVTRTVGAKGTTENLVTVAWKGDPAVSNSPYAHYFVFAIYSFSLEVDLTCT